MRALQHVIEMSDTSNLAERGKEREIVRGCRRNMINTFGIFSELLLLLLSLSRIPAMQRKLAHAPSTSSVVCD
jgi:hypothetical protein